MINRLVAFSAALALAQGALPGAAHAAGYVGSYDSGSTPVVTFTPNGSSHAAGSAVGNLQKVPLGAVPGGTAEIENLLWQSSGGSTGVLVIRMWDKFPGATTCTDQQAYVGSATDDQHLVYPPFSITPAAPGSTQGDAKTYASQAFAPPVSIANQDTASQPYVYVCAVTVATDTADESAAIALLLSGPQNR